MLFRLRMSAGNARNAYVKFMKAVFAQKKQWFWQKSIFKTSLLEEQIVSLISKQLGNENAKTEQMVEETAPKW